eukprot:TRINITY_DN20679_c0_g1_i1.p1 TRINITY_DN20679_c0_g1~~TRINITY_DN20679_c0_g1_i1.p1  ORF type:complete len:195 (-),score=46.98 TRINITY_DN20679_c0_g1_i1:184-711(-)
MALVQQATTAMPRRAQAATRRPLRRRPLLAAAAWLVLATFAWEGALSWLGAAGKAPAASRLNAAPRATEKTSLARTLRYVQESTSPEVLQEAPATDATPESEEAAKKRKVKEALNKGDLKGAFDALGLPPWTFAAMEAFIFIGEVAIVFAIGSNVPAEMLGWVPNEVRGLFPQLT